VTFRRESLSPRKSRQLKRIEKLSAGRALKEHKGGGGNEENEARERIWYVARMKNEDGSKKRVAGCGKQKQKKIGGGETK